MNKFQQVQVVLRSVEGGGIQENKLEQVWGGLELGLGGSPCGERMGPQVNKFQHVCNGHIGPSLNRQTDRHD